MKPVPFLGGAYESRSVPADHQRCVNLFAEVDKEGGVSALYGTPGTAVRYTVKAPIRGCLDMGGHLYFVGGDTLYQLGATAIARGTLQTSTGRVSMAKNDTTLLIVDGVTGYTLENTFAAIADVDFPKGVTKADWEGQYFVVGVDGTKQFFISELGTGMSWSGLDFASAENKPETLVSLVVSHNRLILFTATGAEQWVNTGEEGFPFTRDNGSSIEVGCEARDSVVTMNNGLYWLGRDRDGGGIVFAMQGGVPTRISTHAIEHAIQQYARRDDAYAFAYQQEGHSFYVLTFPTAEQTWVYDAATQKWHERAFWSDGEFSRWRPCCHGFDGRNLVGDYETGEICELSLDVNTDKGGTLRRLRTTPPMRANGAWMTFNALRLDMETGPSPEGKVMMRYSDDGGHTWSNELVEDIGHIGEFSKKVMWWQNGSTDDVRVWEFAMSDAADLALFGLWADIEVTQ